MKYPNIADLTGKFVYARLQRGKDTVKTAYPVKDIQGWAGRLRAWTAGTEPDDLPRVIQQVSGKKTAREVFAREVFAYVIHEGKIRAPAGAMALIAAVSS